MAGAVRRRLVRKWYACFALWYSPYELLRFKSGPDYRAADYVRLLGFVRHFALVPSFWRAYVPILALPLVVLRVAQALRRKTLKRLRA